MYKMIEDQLTSYHLKWFYFDIEISKVIIKFQYITLLNLLRTLNGVLDDWSDCTVGSK